jgi:hypothetical protein
VRHPDLGIAASRPSARSSEGDPQRQEAVGLTNDSAAKTNSFRVVEAQRRDARPARARSGSSTASATSRDVINVRPAHRLPPPAGDVPGMRPRAASVCSPSAAPGAGRASDSDRVGYRQPPPGGGLGAPHQLRGSSGTSTARAAPTVRYPHTGVAAPRPSARSSDGDPRQHTAIGLTSDSAAKTDSFRVVEAQRRGAKHTSATAVVT